MIVGNQPLFGTHSPFKTKQQRIDFCKSWHYDLVQCDDGYQLTRINRRKEVGTYTIRGWNTKHQNLNHESAHLEQGPITIRSWRK